MENNVCITPTILPSIGPVACHKFCWQCRENRINDLVGRCIAEEKYSTKTLAVTLTYAKDSPNAGTLVYADVQKFLKTLRKKHSVRYIVAGEYGSRKKRAHWHIILFFKGSAPATVRRKDDIKDASEQIAIEERISWGYWKHGFSYFQQPTYDGFRYLLKYALKDAISGSTTTLSMSKKPPLGHDFFMDRARHYVEQGLSPQDLFYSFGDQYDKRNKRRRFYLRGKTKENFLDCFLTEYYEQKGRDHPFSQLILDYQDELCDPYEGMTEEEILKRLNYKPVRYIQGIDKVVPTEILKEWHNATEITGTYEGINCVCTHYQSGKFVVAFGENDNGEGAEIWQVESEEIKERILSGLLVENQVLVRDRLSKTLSSFGDQPIQNPLLSENQKRMIRDLGYLKSEP